MTNEEKHVRIGKIAIEDLILETNYYKDFKKSYLIKIFTDRSQLHIATFVDEDGEDWLIVKELYTNRYRRIKRKSVKSIEVIEA